MYCVVYIPTNENMAHVPKQNKKVPSVMQQFFCLQIFRQCIAKTTSNLYEIQTKQAIKTIKQTK